LGTLREAYTKQCGGVRKKVESNKVVSFRADTLITLLEEYIPMLETLFALVEQSMDGKLQGLETVWTSVLTNNWEDKALSKNLHHERMQVYFLYGQAVYSQASMKHQAHRVEMQTEDMKETRGGGDDLSTLKDIISELKQASGIWDWLSSVESKCYPVKCENKTPEVFQDIPRALSEMALANAQELMIQVAVQTKKSDKLVTKLAEGIAVQHMEALQIAQKGLGAQARMLSHDISVYLDRRSKLYHGIALKYWSKVKLEEEKYGERVAVLEAARKHLEGLEISPLVTMEQGGFLQGKKEKIHSLSLSHRILVSSIKDQLQAVNLLLDEAKSDNDQVYHYKVPRISQHDSVDHVKFMKPTKFTPFEAIVLLSATKQIEELAVEKPSEDDEVPGTPKDEKPRADSADGNNGPGITEAPTAPSAPEISFV